MRLQLTNFKHSFYLHTKNQDILFQSIFIIIVKKLVASYQKYES